LRARRVALAAYLLAATCLLAYCIVTNGNSLIITVLRFVVSFAAIRLLLHWARKRAGNA